LFNGIFYERREVSDTNTATDFSVFSILAIIAFQHHIIIKSYLFPVQALSEAAAEKKTKTKKTIHCTMELKGQASR